MSLCQANDIAGIGLSNTPGCQSVALKRPLEAKIALQVETKLEPPHCHTGSYIGLGCDSQFGFKRSLFIVEELTSLKLTIIIKGQ